MEELLQQLKPLVSSELLQKLESLDFNWEQFAKAAILLAAVNLVLSAMGHFVFGRRSGFNHAVSSAIGILFVYALTITLASMGAQFERFVAPLPFIHISGENLTLFSFMGADYVAICYQVLGMVILAFLANLIDGLLPRGKHIITWFFFRCVTVALAMVLHVVVSHLMTAYMPTELVTYAPVILLGLLVLLLLVGALKFVVGAVLVSVNPLIAAFYTFFFASFVGKQLTKAMLTTAILSGLVYGLNYLGITAISIAGAALIAYIPLLILLLVVWYIVNKLL